MRVNGIVSSVQAHNTNFDYIIENCYNKNIKLYAKYSGGIVGYSNVGTGCKTIVRNCFSIGGKIGYDFEHIHKSVNCPVVILHLEKRIMLKPKV